MKKAVDMETLLIENEAGTFGSDTLVSAESSTSTGSSIRGFAYVPAPDLEDRKLLNIYQLSANETDAEPAVNACNTSWIERGLRFYGQELYPIRVLDMEGIVVVDHYGDGSLDDGRRWYKKYISDLAEPKTPGWYVSTDGRYVLVFDGPDQPLPWSYGSADDITIGDQFAEFDHEFVRWVQVRRDLPSECLPLRLVESED